MKKMISVLFIGMVLVSVGCSNNEQTTISSSNPTAQEVLEQDSDADILMYNGIVYNTNVDWVDELTLTKGEEVGEINEQADEGNYDYSNGMANKLSVGSIIFEAKEREDVLIVEDKGEEHYYYALVEG